MFAITRLRCIEALFPYILLLLMRSEYRLLVYSCFDKGCPAEVKKHTRQRRMALWVVRVWFCLIEVQGDPATRNEKKQIPVCALSFNHAETP